MLLTGFEPFGGLGVNASWEVAQALPAIIDGAEVARVRLPVSFSEAGETAVAAVRRLEPDLVVALGEHQGGGLLEVERVALNLASAPGRPDNSGDAPVDEPLVPGAPYALPATLPVEACCSAAIAAGVPCRLSCSAGLYVCNAVMYALLWEQERAGGPDAVGFVHVPVSPATAASRLPVREWPSMTTELAARGVEVVVREALRRMSSCCGGDGQ